MLSTADDFLNRYRLVYLSSATQSHAYLYYEHRLFFNLDEFPKKTSGHG